MARPTFRDAVLAQKFKRAQMHPQTPTAAEHAEAQALFEEVSPRSTPVACVPTAQQQSEPATARKLCHEHREKTSTMSWGVVCCCTHWDCQWGTNVTGEWRRKTHSNQQKIALPFDPNENLAEDGDAEVEELQVIPQTPVPVAGQDEESEDSEAEAEVAQAQDDAEGDAYAAYATED